MIERKFVCDKCGLCCTQLDKSSIYAELDRGDGVCKFWDEDTRLCTIYKNRPLQCNVNRAYGKWFKDKFSKEEYCQLNYEACRRLKANCRRT